MLLTEDRFARLTQAARSNLRTVLDLIAIHSEQPVKGTQPRASLNPFTVLAAVGSWERFIADLTSAATEANWHGPGGHPSTNGAHWPRNVDGRLTELGLLPSPITPLWEAKFPISWRGVEPRGWRTVLRESPDSERKQLIDYLAQTRATRNGAAHYALVKNARDAAKKADQDGWYPWQSDANSPSLQSGYARGVTAVYLQLIDCTTVIVAQAHGWSAETYRPPSDWFRDESRSDRFVGVRFWGGASLHRTSA